ncbi:hypothetical protein Hanom_Chr09g00780031 [Helianthus anomalus]
MKSWKCLRDWRIPLCQIVGNPYIYLGTTGMKIKVYLLNFNMYSVFFPNMDLSLPYVILVPLIEECASCRSRGNYCVYDPIFDADGIFFKYNLTCSRVRRQPPILST